NTKSVQERLVQVDWTYYAGLHSDLLAFYHPEALREICALRAYLIRRTESCAADEVDHWIRMVATNRLTGHSAGFFSVYTLPPNQALKPERQRKINEVRGQIPPRRSVFKLIIRKTESLLQGITALDRSRLSNAAEDALLLIRSADHTPELKNGSVDLIVTSPPFFDVVDY